MGSFGIVEINPPSQPLSQRVSICTFVDVHALVLERPPQSFDENVVSPNPLAIHGYLGVVVLQKPRESKGGELAALVGVEDIKRPVIPDASSRAATQKSASRVFDKRQESTLRLCQSMAATRYMKPLGIGKKVMSAAKTGAVDGEALQ